MAVPCMPYALHCWSPGCFCAHCKIAFLPALSRFGGMPSQMKALFDATGGLWTSNKLAGKPAAMFTSTASQGGGQETTIQNCGPTSPCALVS